MHEGHKTQDNLKTVFAGREPGQPSLPLVRPEGRVEATPTSRPSSARWPRRGRPRVSGTSTSSPWWATPSPTRPSAHRRQPQVGHRRGDYEYTEMYRASPARAARGPRGGRRVLETIARPRRATRPLHPGPEARRPEPPGEGVSRPLAGSGHVPARDLGGPGDLPGPLRRGGGNDRWSRQAQDDSRRHRRLGAYEARARGVPPARHDTKKHRRVQLGVYLTVCSRNRHDAVSDLEMARVEKMIPTRP